MLLPSLRLYRSALAKRILSRRGGAVMGRAMRFSMTMFKSWSQPGILKPLSCLVQKWAIVPMTTVILISWSSSPMRTTVGNEGLKYQMALRPRVIAADILVRTPEELEQAIAERNPLIKQILKTGRWVYGELRFFRST